jgi:hypothetical protein
MKHHLFVNSPDHMQTVQRLSDEEVRHSRETRPLAPTSYSSLCQDQPWHMAAQSQDKFTSRRSRQTLHGSSSSASATVAPLYQPENFRRSSDADISTQFGGKPFVGGSTVCIVLTNASGWSCIIAALLEPDLLTAQSLVLVQFVNRHLVVAHSCPPPFSMILDKAKFIGKHVSPDAQGERIGARRIHPALLSLKPSAADTCRVLQCDLISCFRMELCVMWLVPTV